ncbi:hypothetical protein J0S82_005553 [Galemys pyrenaicus]|uniref:Uncharacterized protein n=1 Tax=Galemys pyrenaicus TaxID=202257 RepID=A0A8J5ZPC9_GALPY|nr:hypothetical protein J0S82_005553 [Galemys pyrenaicus]
MYAEESGKITIQEFMTNFANTLIPNTTEKNENSSLTESDYVFLGDKDQIHGINTYRNGFSSISNLQQNLDAIGIYLPDDKIKNTLDNINTNGE